MAQRAERVDVHACKTLSASGLREASSWPRNGLRSNLIASKFREFSGGGAMASSCVMDGREEPDRSCTRRGGEGRVLSVDGRVEGSENVPNVGSGFRYTV